MFDPKRWNEALAEYLAWLAKDIRLSRADGTAFHKLLDDWRARTLIEGPPVDGFDPEAHFKLILGHKFEVFVVEHDWAAAFSNSDIHLGSEDGTQFYFRQPYDYCVFEFVVTGKRVLLTSSHVEGTYQFSGFVNLSLGWFPLKLGSEKCIRLRTTLYRQHQAIMVALDAAVATTEVIRAPFALNRAREKRGKLPLFDYHTVVLARRTRPATLPPEQESERNKVRLHFRRGHWRHFDKFKTWINWMLVGDPDLGFIDKHYRL